jgi:hypothetical protein
MFEKLFGTPEQQRAEWQALRPWERAVGTIGGIGMLLTAVLILVLAKPLFPSGEGVGAETPSVSAPQGAVYTPLGSPEGQRLLRKPTGQLEAEIHSATLETRLAAAQATAEMYRKWYVEERDRHAPAEVVKKP